MLPASVWSRLLGLAFGLGGKEWAAGVPEKLASQIENTPPYE
jgi:hypothetical protein